MSYALYPTWTDRLTLPFIRFPWFSKTGFEAFIKTNFIPLIKGLPELIGYYYKYYEIDWDRNEVRIYFLKVGSPIAPVVLAAIAAVIIGVGFAIGFSFTGLSWYEKEKAELTRQDTIAQSAAWIRENADKIGADKAAQALTGLGEAAKPPAPTGDAWTQLPTMIAGIVPLILIFFVLSYIPKPEKK